MSRVVCFGDSWGYGSELDFLTSQPFAYHVAQRMGHSNVLNFSVPGSSAGMILHTLTQQIQSLDSNDVVLVIVPPDTRWYDQDLQGNFISIGVHDCEYKNFVGNKNFSWFEYHHGLFAYTMQKLLQDKQIKYSMALNYGKFDYLANSAFGIDTEKFAAKMDLTSALLELPYGYAWSNKDFPNEDGPSEHFFKGKYFDGCRWHPNGIGHQFIAKLFAHNLKTNHLDLNITVE